MTFQEALNKFMAAGPHPASDSEMQAYLGASGTVYLATIGDCDYGMDVSDEGTTLFRYNGETGAWVHWDFKLTSTSTDQD